MYVFRILLSYILASKYDVTNLLFSLVAKSKCVGIVNRFNDSLINLTDTNVYAGPSVGSIEFHGMATVGNFFP